MKSQKRIRLQEPIRALFRSGASRGLGLVHDVSLGGLFVRSALLLPPGARVAVALRTAGGGSLAIRGKVVWNTASVSTPLTVSGFGIRVTRATRQFAGFVSGALAAAG